MAKLTREKMLAERRCGLKYWDAAVNAVGREALIEEALKIHNQFPDVWGYGWPNINWALGNAMREAYIKHIKKGKQIEIQTSFNLDDVLTPEEMNDIAIKCNITASYVPHWTRQ